MTNRIDAKCNFRICPTCDRKVEWSCYEPAPQGWEFRYGLGRICPDCVKQADAKPWTRRTRGFCLCRALAVLGLTACLGALARAAFADLPTDPFQRCAVKALRWDFGRLADWQRAAYKRGLAKGVTADRRAWLTAYYGTRPDGRRDRYGNPCTWRTAAARDEPVPRRAYIWTAQSGLRQVLDTGAKSNIDAAQRPPKEGGGGPGTIWIDAWLPSARHNHWGSTVTPLAVIE
jgi:hypothetical protein